MRVFLDVFNWGLPRKIGYTVVFKVEYVGKDVKDEGRCGYILGLFYAVNPRICPPLDYRSNAQIMLKENMSVTEVCFACGFDDCSNFIRTFKKNNREDTDAIS